MEELADSQICDEGMSIEPDDTKKVLMLRNQCNYDFDSP